MRTLVGLAAALTIITACTPATHARPSRDLNAAPVPGSASPPARHPRTNPEFRAWAATRVDAQTVWMIGSVSYAGGPSVFRSHDGGRSWHVVAAPPGDLSGSSITFANSRDGWIVRVRAGEQLGALYATHDGGTTWRQSAERLRVARVTAGRDRVYLTAATSNGYAIYAGRATTDRFVELVPSAGPELTRSGAALYSYSSRSDPEGRDGAGVLTSVRAGRATTRRLPCGSGTWSAALAATGPDSLVVVCGALPGVGNQLKQAYASPDAGATWRAVGAPGMSGYVGAAGYGAAGVFVCGGRMSLTVSRDGGEEWTTAIGGSGTAGGFSDVAFADPMDGVAVDGGPPSALYLTDDGGLTWRAAAS